MLESRNRDERFRASRRSLSCCRDQTQRVANTKQETAVSGYQCRFSSILRGQFNDAGQEEAGIQSDSAPSCRVDNSAVVGSNLAPTIGPDVKNGLTLQNVWILKFGLIGGG